jgi:hypothetical protein
MRQWLIKTPTTKLRGWVLVLGHVLGVVSPMLTGGVNAFLLNT